MNMRYPLVFGLLSLSMLFGRPALAQEGSAVAEAPVEVIAGRAPVRLELDVHTGTLRQVSPTGKFEEEWIFDSGVIPVARIARNRPISFEIKNANPLLYTYQLEAAVVRTRTSPGCRVSAGAFLTDGLLAGSTVFSGLTEGGFEGGALADMVGLLDEMPQLRGTELTSLQLDSYVQGIRASVLRAVDRSEGLVEILESVEDSLALIARSAEMRPLADLSDAYVEGLEAFEPGLGVPVSVAAAVERVLNASGEDLAVFRSTVVALRGESKTLAATPAARSVLRWAGQLEELASRALGRVGSLQSALAQLNHATARSTIRFAIASGDGDSRRLTIRVARTANFPELFRAREGQITAYTTPKPSLRCSVGVGVVWTSPAADYSIDEDGLIEDLSQGDDLAVSPALLFEIGLPQLSFLSFHGGIGAGRARVPDLFAGGSLHLSPKIGFALGLVWRRVRALPAGTRIGGELPEGVGLSDLEHEFDRQLYWGITFTR